MAVVVTNQVVAQVDGGQFAVADAKKPMYVVFNFDFFWLTHIPVVVILWLTHRLLDLICERAVEHHECARLLTAPVFQKPKPSLPSSGSPFSYIYIYSQSLC